MRKRKVTGGDREKANQDKGPLKKRTREEYEQWMREIEDWEVDFPPLAGPPNFVRRLRARRRNQSRPSVPR
jgi:hypothetical protein